MKTRVAVFFGGRSVEHEVSVISAIQAIYAMDTEKYEIYPVYIAKDGAMYYGENTGKIEAYKDIPALLKESSRVILVSEQDQFYLISYPQKLFGAKKIQVDLAFPIVHGTNEEDGTLMGYLKTVGIPFVGSNLTAAAVGMDKYITKAILKDNDIPVLDCLRFRLKDYKNMDALLDKTEKVLGYPVIVKPVNSGSSVGIAVARDRGELVHAVDDAFSYAGTILIEHAIMHLREINCSVLGDENEAIPSVCEEPFHSDEILSFKDKYESGGKSGGSKGMASVSRKIPADLSPEMTKRVQDMAVESFQALGCSGVARIDFMIDEDNGALYFNEINTIPGSLSFYLWEPMGVPYRELLDRMIKIAEKQNRQEKSLTFTFQTNILNSNALGGAKGSKMGK
ncbi:MAG: D-alanine--D-alanine ligase [Lachnospiraceae bacterium]|nr:D-alanine--D-alanine ligase [Lachnospiraceae bacterium]